MMVLTFGACATAEVVASAASAKLVMKAFTAGLLLGCRDWLSNNVTLGALAEVQREAVHSHRKSWCAGRQSDSRTSVVTAGDCRTPNQVPTASLLRAGVSRFQCNRPRGKLPRSAREMKDATADVHRRARWDGVRNAFTGSRDRDIDLLSRARSRTRQDHQSLLTGC